MRGLLPTSFDRYARYAYVAEVRASLPDRPLRILDVGDPYGTLSHVFESDHTVSLDLFAQGAPVSGSHRHVVGSGFQLPFPAGSFDLVASHDVFEHLPVSGRMPFVDELLRVAAGPVVLVAPFANPCTSACEQMVNAYYVARTGTTLEPLDEHAEGGLPPLDDLLAHLDGGGVEAFVHSDGWLHHWLTMMMLKAHFVAEGMAAEDRAADLSFNLHLRDRDRRGPHYRRAIVMRPPPGAARPAPSPPQESGDEAALRELGWQLMQLLPRGENPLAAGSTFAEWAATSAGPDATVALRSSMATLIEGVARARSEPLVAPAWPSTAVVVADADDAALRATVESLLAQVPEAPDEILLSVPGPHDGLWATATSARVRQVVDPTPDRIIRLNHLVEQAQHSCVVLVEPGVVVPETALGALIGAFDPRHRVTAVAPTVDPADRPSSVRHLTADANGDVLYAPRSLMVFDRDTYRFAGGFEGRMLGVLDDVDFGWRLGVLGHRIREVPLAQPVRLPSAARSADQLAQDRMVAWTFAKNADVGPGVLAELVRVATAGPEGTPDVGAAIALLDGRDEVQRRRHPDARTEPADFGSLAVGPDLTAVLGARSQHDSTTVAPADDSDLLLLISTWTLERRGRFAPAGDGRPDVTVGRAALPQPPSPRDVARRVRAAVRRPRS